MKLKHEYGFFASLLVLFVIIGISSAFFIYERKLLIQDLKEREKSIYNSFSEMSKESLSLHDELLLLNYMSLTKKINKEIVYMLYESPDGHLLSVPKSSELKYLFDTKEKLSDESNERILFSPEGIEINELAKLIYLNGKANGEIRIGFSQDILRQEVKKTLRTTGEKIIIIALVTLLLSIFAAMLLAGKMTRPISKIARGAKAIGEGDLEQQIELKAKGNELSDLAVEFNNMAMKLKELDEMKDNFISSVSHELKSPLSYIKGYLELFLSDESIKLSDEHKEYVEVIKKNIDRLSRFISDILDLSKIKVGRILIEKQICDLQIIAQEAVDFSQPGAIERKITLSSNVPSGLPPAYCDTEKICQVLNNLIGNALKFTPEGGTITIDAIDTGDNLEFSVQDSGIGIPKDQLGMVFEKFKQVKSNSDKISNVKGTGLGLAIVKGILDAHGERIWVESELDQGCNFRFTISKNI